MVTPQMFLLDLTVESGIPGDVMRHLYTAIILWLFHVMTDFLWIWLMMDSNTTCDEDSNTTCDEDSNTTCDEDSNTICDEDSNETCDEDSNNNNNNCIYNM